MAVAAPTFSVRLRRSRQINCNGIRDRMKLIEFDDQQVIRQSKEMFSSDQDVLTL